MRFGWQAAIAIAATIAPGAALAGSREVIQPLQLGEESIRFDRGDYIVDLPGRAAAVQIRPMPADHDNVSFVVALLNTGVVPINVDIGNVQIEGAAEPVHLVSRAEMEHKAANRAGWAKAITTVAGALGAAAQANQRNYYRVTTATPHYAITSTFSTPCYSCRAAADETLAMTGARVAQIQDRLDQTRRALGEGMLQLTTVDPGRSYGGRIFLSRFKHEAMKPMRLVVTIGEERFAFGFRFAPDGTPMPAYRLPVPAVAAAPATAQSLAAQPVTVQPVAAPAVALMPAAPSPAVAPSARIAPAAFPVPAAPAFAAAGPGAAAHARWQRYYNGLIANGTPRGQARSMADEQFGPAG